MCLFGTLPAAQALSRAEEFPLGQGSWGIENCRFRDLAERQISQLSGGQFQRVLIARCLVQEADCIFLDEPFVGIDSVSEEIIMSTLRSLKAAGKIILIVHHDLSKVVDYFDQVILLNRKLIAFGPTETSFNKDNMKKTYGSQLFMNGGD